jgi:cytochrome c-type biogenesis protein CcmE
MPGILHSTGIMKNRIGVIVLFLVLVCVGLGIALIAIKQQAAISSATLP